MWIGGDGGSQIAVTLAETRLGPCERKRYEGLVLGNIS